MKKCPYCAEEIQDNAIKCRFCGEYLKKKKWWKNCLIGCLIAFFGSILLLFLLIYFSFLMLKFFVYHMFFPAAPSPQHYYPPFMLPPGLDYMLRDFGEFFRTFWERLMEFLRLNTQRVI